MILNNAPAIYVDGKMAERVYSDGEIVWGLPKGYTRCKYLESNGKQWIDTGLLSGNDVGILIDFQFKQLGGGQYLCGSYPNVGRFSPIFIDDNKPEQVFAYTPQLPFVKRTIIDSDTLRHMYKYNLFNSHEITIDGATIEEVIPTSGVSSNTIALFARKSDGTGDLRAKARVFSFRVTRGNYAYAVFIPCYSKYESRPCMYDTITKQPFYNQGTGEFGCELLDGTYVAPI